MQKPASLLLFSVALLCDVPCRADVVEKVNALALATAAPPGSNVALRTLVVANLAMFDAANAITPRYTSYRVPPAPPANASPDAVALAAGCAAIAEFHPQQRAATAKSCDEIAAALPAGAMTDDARRFGETVARDLVATRRDDGLGAPNRYVPATSAGVYVPTVFPVGYDVATTKPFALTSASQFRPGPPPALDGATWARDYNEIKSLGARDSTTRSAVQTTTAQFWGSTGFQQFNDAMADNAVPESACTVPRARHYALVYMSLFDAAIAHFDAKYTYGFWRPVTAIRNGQLGGNAATQPDLAWLPLIDAPMHPEYPCAHCNSAAVFAGILVGLRGTERRTLIVRAAASFTPRNATREYPTEAELVADAVNARVWSGIHFRNSAETGAAMGRQIARYMLSTQLRPLP